MSLEISHIDTLSAPDEVLFELADYEHVIDAEIMPGDPPTPREALLAHWRNMPPYYAVDRWTLREDGEIVAQATTECDMVDNLQNGFGWIHVHPDHRGRGLVRELATPMFDQLENDGRVRFATWAKNGAPIEGRLEALGLKAALGDKRSRLLIADLDMDLMRLWTKRAQERAEDYELRYYPMPVPDSILDDFCEMYSIMNTAPMEDYEHEDETLTPELWRQAEESVLAEHSLVHNLVAVHVPSGAFAGFTQIKTQDLQPDLAWQWNTGVHPDHRNKGLGRWLKADMIQRIVHDYPGLTRVDTYNAGSNEPMLNINIAMGFKPVLLSTIWQGDLATVRERFGA